MDDMSTEHYVTANRKLPKTVKEKYEIHEKDR